MTMTAPVAGLRITRDLRAAEAALDEALMKHNTLFATLLSARQNTEEAGPFTGHEILLRLIKSQQTLLAAGGDLARVHGGLSDMGREMGAAVHDCPEDGPIGFVDGEDEVRAIAA
ncbi:hypothetical protein [Croceibacterium ferulae]|uniref:hypothetical protein n=1 Tax=Croceibacterium ferulae TaxID=1854641 RepID=UPI000EB38C3A|nr:hypothetical protein [Croceibacterium ferulae]